VLRLAIPRLAQEPAGRAGLSPTCLRVYGRDFSRRYGDYAYHLEEICAELGAAYPGAHLGLPLGHLHDHSAYIRDWIALMKRDRRAFFDAAAKAQAAVDWLLIKSGRVAQEIADTGGEGS